MKVLHLAFAGTDQAGVHRKLSEQVHALRAHGATVESIVFVSEGTALAAVAPYQVVEVPGGGFGARGRVAAFDYCRQAVARFAPDVIYLRYPVYDEYVLRFVRDMPPVVFELQTIFANEAPPLVAREEGYWASRILPETAGLVAVTGEILRHEIARTGYAVPGHVMPNGADPQTIPFTPPELATDRINLVCVASCYPWHGIDRLVVGFAAEREVDDVHLHVIGDGPTLPDIVTLAREAGVSDRVHCHGAMPVSALTTWYAATHVAVGSLAPHRVGLRELAALKHREYVLRGLPMIIGGADADIPHTAPWCRQFPADDTPISPRTVRALALGWTHEARRRQIRTWAEGHVAWDAKIPALLAFLRACVAQGKRVHQVA